MPSVLVSAARPDSAYLPDTGDTGGGAAQPQIIPNKLAALHNGAATAAECSQSTLSNSGNGVICAGVSPHSSSTDEFRPSSLEHVLSAAAYPLKSPYRVSSHGEMEPHKVSIASTPSLNAVQELSSKFSRAMALEIGGDTVDCSVQQNFGTDPNANTSSHRSIIHCATANGDIAADRKVRSNSKTAENGPISSNDNAKENDLHNQLPFALLEGEGVKIFGPINFGGAIYLTNYRLLVAAADGKPLHNVPVLSLDTVEARDLFSLMINTKDGRIFKITADNSESCLTWYKQLAACSAGARPLRDCFALAFCAWCRDAPDKLPKFVPIRADCRANVPDLPDESELAKSEFERLGFGDNWRLTRANEGFGLVPSYPPSWIVPASFSDAQVAASAGFRYNSRLPAVVWRHRATGAVLLRSSQPSVGILGWRCDADEKLLEYAIAAVKSDVKKAQCTTPRGAGRSNVQKCLVNGSVQMDSGKSVGKDEIDTTPCKPATHNKTSLLIVDARSYAAALVNRTRGGGFENSETYQDSQIEYMGMANIHNIRSSFQQLRLLISPYSSESFLTGLHNSQWLQHVSSLLSTGVKVAETLTQGRSVLVHCSDGWDRTTQVVALAKLMLDPYYRSIAGFAALVTREWLEFGHKFADRCGAVNGDPNERAPVFLQWLDAVHQLRKQAPGAFQFNDLFLIKLAQHTYSGLFGTFLCNSLCESSREQLSTRTFSVWTYLHPGNDKFVNVLYEPVNSVLWPKSGLQSLDLWRKLYELGTGANHDECTDIQRAQLLQQSAMERSVTRAHSVDSLDKAPGNLQSSVVELPHPQQAHSPPGSECHLTSIGAAPMHAAPITNGSGSSSNVPGASANGAILAPNRSGSEPSLNGSLVERRKESAGEVNGTGPQGDMASSIVTELSLTMAMRPLGNDIEIPAAQSNMTTQNGHPLSSSPLNSSGDPSLDTTDYGCDAEYFRNTPPQCKENGRNSSRLGSFVRRAVLAGSSITNGRQLSPDRTDPLTDTVHEHRADAVSVSRRSCTAEMVTSTSEISESQIRLMLDEASQANATAVQLFGSASDGRRSASGDASAKRWRQFLDDDGLTRIIDQQQDRLHALLIKYERTFVALERAERAARLEAQKLQLQLCAQAQGGAHEGGGASAGRGEYILGDTCTSNQGGDHHGTPSGGAPWPQSSSTALGLGIATRGRDDSSGSWESVKPDALPVTGLDVAPVRWVPDHAATHCMGCDATFWSYNRRHHCRWRCQLPSSASTPPQKCPPSTRSNCGKVFCSACSDYYCRVPREQLHQPVRVCAACFARLRHTVENMAPGANDTGAGARVVTPSAGGAR